jgi:hypothetical protein
LSVLHHLDPRAQPYLLDHAIGGYPDQGEQGVAALCSVPLAMAIELMAEATSLRFPDLRLVEIRDLVARDFLWVDGDTELLVRARPVGSHVARAIVSKPGPSGARVCAEGEFRFAAAFPTWQPLSVPMLRNPRACRLTAAEMYSERFMFHGPSLQGVSELGPIGDNGMDGSISVGDGAGLLRGLDSPEFVTDPVLLDSVAQMFGFWPFQALDRDPIVFPIKVQTIRFHGDLPDAGAQTRVRIRTRHVSRKSILGDIEVTHRSRRLLDIQGWEFWRFNWPLPLIDLMRQPTRHYATRPCTDAHAEISPSDVTTSLWHHAGHLELLELVVRAVLNRAEYAAFASLPIGGRERKDFVITRLVIKEAVRRWVADRSAGSLLYPSAIEISPKSLGRVGVGVARTSALGGRVFVAWKLSENGAAAAASAAPLSVGVVVDPDEAAPHSPLPLTRRST